MRITNKKADFLYQISERGIEAGLALIGVEARTLRDGRADLAQASVRVMNDGMYLINANFPINAKNGSPTRARKLLLNKHEILSLTTKIKQQKLALIPLSVYNKRSLRPDGRKGRDLFKLELGLGKPKKQYEKKESLKQKDMDRDLAKELKDRS